MTSNWLKTKEEEEEVCLFVCIEPGASEPSSGHSLQEGGHLGDCDCEDKRNGRAEMIIYHARMQIYSRVWSLVKLNGSKLI